MGGIPAKVIKYRFTASEIASLLEIKWWDYHYKDFSGMDLNFSGTQMCAYFKRQLPKIEPYSPEKIYLS